jgi:hypothetical protein
MFSNHSSSNSSSNNNISRLLTPPPVQSDPKRQSQMLMESKRRSLAIKDTDLLEQMLRGDLEGFHHQQRVYQPSEDELDEDTEEEEDNSLSHSKLLEETRSASPSTIMILEEDRNKGMMIDNQPLCCFTCNGFPCTFPCQHSQNNNSKTNDPFALFTGVTIVLGIASQLGITDDWTVPITLATLVSSFLWAGSKNKTKI